jgi:flagellar basal body-associated protein FliL
MEKLILTMIVCLILAIILGIVLGVFWSNTQQEEEIVEEVDENELLTRLNELEALYKKEKELRVEYDKKNRELKGQLIKKMTILSSTSDTLKNIQSKTPTLESQEIINDLKEQLKMKNRELKEFEEVLCKAEETIENLKDK